MILGIGLDLLNINRIEKVYNMFSDKFADRILSEYEMNEYKKIKNNHSKFIAKRFCVKESFTKALGLGIGRGVNLKDITYMKDELGKPFISLGQTAADFLLKRYNSKINIYVTLTDDGDYMSALSIIETA
ncbi:MAG: holo-ACP synthase [Rickettsiales bacterium]|jgi:holo-[acyl-carrier protein] synthase|nr:holo-ACP synthase [Rickettsiales bacterium]